MDARRSLSIIEWAVLTAATTAGGPPQFINAGNGQVILIGDVHGKFARYKKILKRCRDSVQVGDMGVGFENAYGIKQPNPPHRSMVEGNHRFIRGNHDNPAVCVRHSQWIPDGTVEGHVMFIGGALSVDQERRTEGLDWWRGEELSVERLQAMVDVYVGARPRVMVTHDCPEGIVRHVCAASRRRKFEWPSRTRQALQAMWEAHQPELWVFGHHHVSLSWAENGTSFRCLDELEVFETP
jgi:hypothetical protein